MFTLGEGYRLFFVYFLAGAILIYAYRRLVPIHGLKLVKCSDLEQAKKHSRNLKLLDVRDVSEYEADHCHLKESVNISLGRLPFVWEQSLSPEDEVIILAPKKSEGYLAARKLKKAGFTSLSYLTEECRCCPSSR